MPPLLIIKQPSCLASPEQQDEEAVSNEGSKVRLSAVSSCADDLKTIWSKVKALSSPPAAILSCSLPLTSHLKYRLSTPQRCTPRRQSSHHGLVRLLTSSCLLSGLSPMTKSNECFPGYGQLADMAFRYRRFADAAFRRRGFSPHRFSVTQRFDTVAFR